MCYTKVLFHFCCCCSACHKSPKQLYFTGYLYSLIFLFQVVVVTGFIFIGVELGTDLGVSGVSLAISKVSCV